MIAMRLREAAAALGLPPPAADAGFRGVDTDSRRLHRGALFVALRGTRFDGHDFVAAAEAGGAAAALVERPLPLALPQLVVADTRRALGLLARAWRRRHAPQVVGVTGSNGKTTVKEMVAAVAAACGPVLATRGNLNNDIGLPLTLFGLGPEHRTAVLEMGASAPGEIATLAALAIPHVGIVTGAAAAHLEGFGSLEAVARTKGALLEALPPEGVAVFPAEDAFAPLWRGLAAGRRVLDYALGGAGAAVRGEAGATTLGRDGFRTPVRIRDAEGEWVLTLRLGGAHNARNALAAWAAGAALGIAPQARVGALEAIAPPPGRLAPRPARGGGWLIDDSYNANPASLAAGLAVLAGLGGERVLVLGDMAELGAEAEALHREAGAAARRAGIARLHALGPLAARAAEAFGVGGQVHESVGALLDAVEGALGPDTVVLVKGSRAMAMERIVHALAAEG
ncbi:UDP-N-acetylmuramoyl-tripeptide--D-alanyl-D-alanine ligase [Inmirania thermothiophila]|uniref:UDP-N-acetylmuramoyl-tripeptide--D-alanyl-D-alanine ligase n=1 Tax=Inmirania thermothiophila TaxID=1750597 RepID=A0A3N1XSQ6_9GAMM|nr:UDP-N-acetylmuramoyl-tripeptide--D-alanyl-D-alanine ligase [Inmirania thermothiophila]ROR29680.1 UDP-N-acetylmuramoyl-tripeptide--D-alanyl-D-alanine ligase [Inmirania thermothiophila]